MHVQTEPSIPAFEMYINDNVSGQSVTNKSISLLSNESYGTFDNYDQSFEMTRPENQQTARGVCLIIFVAIGTVFNSFMIVSIVPNRRLRTVRNLLLVHLGCAGLLTSFLINLLVAVVSFSGKWFGGVILCQIFGFIMSVLTLVTSWTIATLSWDKYQTIASPLHHSSTTTAVKVCGWFSVLWTIACCFSLPPLLGGSRYVFHHEIGLCFVCTKTLIGKVYIFAYILAAVYIPLAVMLYCYTNIYRIARTHSSRIAATMVRMTCVIQATVAPASHAYISIKGTKAMCTIVQLIGAFMLLYIPISVILLAEIFSDNDFKINPILSSTITMLFHSAPVINSSVYGLRNKILRASFRRYLRRKIRYHCYKDKRKNSVKSFRSASFKAAMLHRRTNQNGGHVHALRRTQSFPVRGSRAGLWTAHAPSPVTIKKNGVSGLLIKETLPRPHSFNVLVPSPEQERTLKPTTVFQDDEDIPDMDADA